MRLMTNSRCFASVMLIMACISAAQAASNVVGWGANLGGGLDAPDGEYIIAAAGYHRSVGLLSDGTIAAWTSSWPAPAGTFIAVDVGYSSYVAIRADGTAVCWGDGGPCIGRGTFTAVSLSRHCVLAIRTDGTLAEWDEVGGLGVPGGTFRAVSAGIETSHLLALGTDGTLVAWGDNR